MNTAAPIDPFAPWKLRRLELRNRCVAEMDRSGVRCVLNDALPGRSLAPRDQFS